jgi:hypothetical protein
MGAIFVAADGCPASPSIEDHADDLRRVGSAGGRLQRPSLLTVQLICIGGTVRRGVNLTVRVYVLDDAAIVFLADDQ